MVLITTTGDLALTSERMSSSRLWHSQSSDGSSSSRLPLSLSTVSERSRALAAAAMELYAGGMLSLKRSCSAAAWEGACSPLWLQGNTFLNDVYAWSILLQALLHNSTVMHAHTPQHPAPKLCR